MIPIFNSQNRNSGEGIIGGYGLHYNENAAVHDDFPPSGWRLPDRSDYDDMLTLLGGDGTAFAAAQLIEVASLRWDWQFGLDAIGFRAYGAGDRTVYTTNFLKELTKMWAHPAGGFSRALLISTTSGDPYTSVIAAGSGDAFSVRFVKNHAGGAVPTYIEDYEGNKYKVVYVAALNQIWTVDNWKSQYMSDGTPLAYVPSTVDISGITIPAFSVINDDIRYT